MREIWRIFCEIFWTHKIKALKFGENFGALFVRKCVLRKNSFVPTSFCRCATLRPYLRAANTRWDRFSIETVPKGGKALHCMLAHAVGWLPVATLDYMSCVFLSSLKDQTAKRLICTKGGVSANSRKSATKCVKPHVLRTFYTKSALLCTLWHSHSLSLWNRQKPHFLCRLMFLPFGL